MEIRYGHHSQEDFRRAEKRERTIDARSVLIGAAVFLCLVAGASMWHFRAAEGVLKRLRNFEFTPAPPETEDFELKDPQRQLLDEQYRDEPEMEDVQTPDVRIATRVEDTTLVEEVIKTDNVEINSEIKIDVAEMDIIDAPEELIEVSDDTAYSITPIASIAPAPADLFRFKEPVPRDRPARELFNRAPRPGRGLKLKPPQFGELEAPTVGELGAVDINLLGSGEYLSALGRSGGLETRTAVDAALRWLALHQEPDGSWAVHKWDDPDVPLAGPPAADGVRRGESEHAGGMTGLAVLGLMGGGHTIRKGEYRLNLVRALEWIMARQDPRTGQLDRNMYEHAIGTIALCEAFGRAPDERLGLAARAAVDFCVRAVGTDGGWRYEPNAAESDMSVTSWFLQALKTAKLADIKFDHRVFSRGQTFADQCTDHGGTRQSTGAVGYQYKTDLSYGTGSPALTCAAMMVRQFSGMGVRAPLLVKGAELTQARPPRWEDKDFYYWYYATYAMHNMGGEYRLWWNRRIRDVLLDNQCKRGHQAGSWDPEDVRWEAGRVYCTALGALCLEVYYRYGEALQSFGTAPGLDDMVLE